uniref:Uncharacterized protein n=1 Tax=Megaselia scalaris TaxID=36166 RepID=T1GB24_MEGSC
MECPGFFISVSRGFGIPLLSFFCRVSNQQNRDDKRGQSSKFRQSIVRSLATTVKVPPSVTQESRDHGQSFNFHQSIAMSLQMTVQVPSFVRQ